VAFGVRCQRVSVRCGVLQCVLQCVFRGVRSAISPFVGGGLLCRMPSLFPGITGLFCGIQGSFSNNTATVPHVHRRNRIVFRKKALHCLINGVVFKITVFGRIQVSFSDNTAKYHTYIEGMGSSFDKKPCIVSLMGSSSNKRVFGRIQGSFSDNTVLFFERRSHSSVYVWCCCSTHSLTHTFFTPLSVV